jgi:hypothetical protein
MSIQQHKRRLKGLDEMPRPRRTLRQHYFRVRSRLRSSALFRIWSPAKFLLVFLALWGLARLLGFRIDL